MASRIFVEKQGSHLTLHAPDHPTLDARAAGLGGKRKGGSWTFPVGQEAAVRKLAHEFFGTSGDDGGAKVTLRVDLSLFGEGSVGSVGEAWLAGRLLARRPTHDARVQLGDGVRLVRGGFGVWGGSRNRPALDARYGTVVDVEGVPRTAAELATQKYPITTAIVTPKVETVVGAWSKTVVTRDVTTKPSAAKSAGGKKVKSKMHSESTMPPAAAPAAAATPAPSAKPAAKPKAKAKPAAKAKARRKAKAKTVKAKVSAAAKSVRKTVKAKAPKARAAAKSAAKTVKSKARAAAKTVKAKAPKAMAAVGKATKGLMARAKAAAKKATAKVRKAVAKAKAKPAKKKATKKK